jgi:hypothetical protein
MYVLLLWRDRYISFLIINWMLVPYQNIWYAKWEPNPETSYVLNVPQNPKLKSILCHSNPVHAGTLFIYAEDGTMGSEWILGRLAGGV